MRLIGVISLLVQLVYVYLIGEKILADMDLFKLILGYLAFEGIIYITGCESLSYIVYSVLIKDNEQSK